MFWIPLAMGGAQMAYGAYQTSRARREEKEARERMEASRPGIPQSVDRMVSRAERVYTEGLDTSRQEEMVGQRTAAGTRAMREGAVSSTQYLGGVTDMYRAELDSLNQIAMERSAFRMRAHEGVMGALQTRAGYEHQNAMLPYQEAQMDRQVATQAGQAGMQNIWGGLQTGVGAAMQHHAGNQQRGLLRDIYGVGGNEPMNYQRPSPKIQAQFQLDKLDAMGARNMGMGMTGQERFRGMDTLSKMLPIPRDYRSEHGIPDRIQPLRPGAIAPRYPQGY